MSEFRVNSITNQDGSAGPQVCGVSTFSGKSGVQIPSDSSDFRRLDGGGRGRAIFSGGYEAPSHLFVSLQKSIHELHLMHLDMYILHLLSHQNHSYHLEMRM